MRKNDALECARELCSVNGSQTFTFGFPTMRAAQAHADARMAQGRLAVTFQDGDVWVCVYGVVGSVNA